MIVTADYVARIKVFYTIKELCDGRENKCEGYLARHGWINDCGLSGNCEYQGVKFTGLHEYKKTFTSMDEMASEIRDIDCAFNDGWSKIEGAYNVGHRTVEPYNSKQFYTK